MPCMTSDYFPTIMDVVGMHKSIHPPLIDGISLLPMIEGKHTKRSMPIGFKSQDQRAWNGEEYKLYSNDKGTTYALYHLPTDLHEDNDLSSQYPQRVEEMKTALLAWEASCDGSDKGGDY